MISLSICSLLCSGILFSPAISGRRLLLVQGLAGQAAEVLTAYFEAYDASIAFKGLSVQHLSGERSP
jgi:hypothetical protein